MQIRLYSIEDGIKENLAVGVKSSRNCISRYQQWISERKQKWYVRRCDKDMDGHIGFYLWGGRRSLDTQVKHTRKHNPENCTGQEVLENRTLQTQS